MSYFLDKSQKSIYKENIKTGTDNINKGLSAFWKNDIEIIWEDIKEGVYSTIFLILIFLVMIFKPIIVRTVAFLSARKNTTIENQTYRTILFNKRRS